MYIHVVNTVWNGGLCLHQQRQSFSLYELLCKRSLLDFNRCEIFQACVGRVGRLRAHPLHI